MQERRTNRRGRVLLGGKIVYGSGFTADVTIRNLTDEGAQVQLPEMQPAPGSFYLIVVRDGVVHRAQTTWTRHPVAGVRFEDTHAFGEDTPVRLQALRDIWTEIGPRRAA